MYLRPFYLLPFLVLTLACTAAEPTTAAPTVVEPSAAESTPPRSAPAERPPVQAPMKPNPAGLKWTLTVEPDSFALSELERVRIVLTARNDSTEALAPLEFRPMDLRIDTEASMALSLAFGNGLTGPRWSSLPAGESATDERVGVAFVDTAGEHVISAHRGDEELARVTVTVR